MNGKFQNIGQKEWIMYKPRWGAFYKTNLETKLNELGIDSLVICGCNFPNCPRTTIYEASERDFKIFFVRDATSGVYEKGINELRDIGIKVFKTNSLINFIEQKNI